MKIIIEDGKSKRIPTVTETSILGFFPPYRWLSNYHLIPVTMPDGLTYPSTENAYQAYKLLSVEDRKPFTAYTPGDSKAAGQKVELRADWEKVKVDVMRLCLEAKFKNPELLDMLLATSPKYLEETNNWGDKFWGKVEGVGQNMLGKLLMELRNREHRTQVWVVEVKFENPVASLPVSVSSSRSLAIEWIKEFGKDWMDAPSNQFSVFRMVVDGGKNSLPKEEGEYFNSDGTPWIFNKD